MNKAGGVPEGNCKHVSSGDNKFTARMRFHQSWYRHAVLNCPPGPNPNARHALYGSMLTEKDGLGGKNFLTPDIFHSALDRYPLDSPSFNDRLYCNMLSSQPMCFNLLAPLSSDPVATILFQRMPGFPADAVVTNIQFEFAPTKQSHLQDASAFDAFLEYQRSDGSRGFVGIETKLTEPFSQKSYAFEERYARWMRVGNWWWKPGAEQAFPDPITNQLWRNHLLAYAILHQDFPTYKEGSCVVIYPEGDETCTHSIHQYRNLLNPAGKKTLLVWTLEAIVEQWRPILEEHDRLSEWFSLFLKRYVCLDESEQAWKELGSDHGKN